MSGTELLDLDPEPLPQPVPSSQSDRDSFLAGAKGVFLEESISRVYGFQLILSPGLRNGPIHREPSSLGTYRDSIAPSDCLHIHVQKASSAEPPSLAQLSSSGAVVSKSFFLSGLCLSKTSHYS